MQDLTLQCDPPMQYKQRVAKLLGFIGSALYSFQIYIF